MLISAKKVQDAAVARSTGKPNLGAHASISFSTSVVKTTGRAPARYFTLSIGGKIASKAEIKKGDVVDLKFDPEKNLGVIAAYPEGWVLSGSKPNRQGLQTLKLRFTWHTGLPRLDGKGECSNILVKKKGLIQFTFPDGTDFPGVDEYIKTVETGKK